MTDLASPSPLAQPTLRDQRLVFGGLCVGLARSGGADPGVLQQAMDIAGKLSEDPCALAYAISSRSSELLSVFLDCLDVGMSRSYFRDTTDAPTFLPTQANPAKFGSKLPGD